MSDAPLLPDLIRLHRERLGLTKDELAQRIGVSRGSVSQWELGLTTPKRNREEDVARALGLSVAELFRSGGGLEEAGAVELRAPPFGGVIRVPRLDRIATMTHGANPTHTEEVVLGSVDLSTSWVSQRIRPSDPAALRIVTAFGDSMSPTFGDGDLLLVDTGVTEVRVDGVYAIRALGRLFLKRVRQRLDGGFIVSSDNPAERTTDELGRKPGEVEIVGRVVWSWNGRKL
jgi:transcriptional regulator with XRE-family HTH domain